MNWLTASAVVAGIIFVLKILTDMWLELQRKKHLCSALSVYIERMNKYLCKAQETFNFDDLKQKIENDERFTPYAVYDSTEGLSLRDILVDYGFLDSKTMGKVVECITAENYLFAFYKELRTEYVRGFSSERKIKFLEQLKKALDNAVDLSKATHEALESLAGQTSVAQLKYWAGTRS